MWWILFLIVVIVILIAYNKGRDKTPTRDRGNEDKALQILREKYAEGEITKEEFE